MKSRKKIKGKILSLCLVGALVGIMFAGTNALAGNVNLTELGTVPGQVVNVNIHSVTPSLDYAGGAYAGSYELLIDSVITPAYCTEFQFSDPNVSHLYQELPLTDTLQNREIAWIVKNYSPSLDPSKYAQNVNAQVAIWEVLGTLGSPPNTNSFSVTDWAGAGAYGSKAGADSIFAAAGAANPGADILSGITLYHNDSYQDYVAPVPEPSALLLFGLGIMGIVGLKRKSTN